MIHNNQQIIIKQDKEKPEKLYCVYIIGRDLVTEEEAAKLCGD